MISVSLCEFARTGRFGVLSLGMSRDEVQRHLGNPRQWNADEQRDAASIWRYSDIEFYFEDHRLYMIFTDHDSLTKGGKTLDIDLWVIRSGLSRHALESCLREQQIEFTVLRPPYEDRQCHIVTKAGVKFSFLEKLCPDRPYEQCGLVSWNQLVDRLE